MESDSSVDNVCVVGWGGGHKNYREMAGDVESRVGTIWREEGDSRR